MKVNEAHLRGAPAYATFEFKEIIRASYVCPSYGPRYWIRKHLTFNGPRASQRPARLDKDTYIQELHSLSPYVHNIRVVCWNGV